MARDALGGLRVGDVMTPDPIVAPGSITVGELIARAVLARPHVAYPVEAADGRITGIVTLDALRRVPPEE